MTRYLSDEALLEAVQRLRPLADESGLTMAQLAVAWTLHNPNVSAAIIGATRPEQVQDTVEASGVQLEQDLLERIDEVLADHVRRDPALTTSPASRDF